MKLRSEAEKSVSDLPALIIKAEKISAKILHGMHEQRKSGAGEKFWQFRDYQSTDRPQDIDWRQSAKTDGVFIKQKEWQTSQRTYIWCAGGASMKFSSDNNSNSKQETAQIISLSLALLLRKSDEQIGFFGDKKTGKSESKIQKISQFLLDRSNIEETLPNSAAFLPPDHSSFIGIGDFLSPVNYIESSILPISSVAKNGIIIQILDPAEIDLTYRGRIRFRGINNNELELINNVTSVRNEYKNRINNHINDIKNLCQRQHWSYILHRTDDDITNTLKDIWIIMNNGVTQK